MAERRWILTVASGGIDVTLHCPPGWLPASQDYLTDVLCVGAVLVRVGEGDAELIEQLREQAGLAAAGRDPDGISVTNPDWDPAMTVGIRNGGGGCEEGCDYYPEYASHATRAGASVWCEQQDEAGLPTRIAVAGMRFDVVAVAPGIYDLAFVEA